MTDMADKITQVRAIAVALFRLPPPARAQIANDLYDQGVRIDPLLATKHVVREGPAQLGNWAPAHLERIDAMDILRNVDPVLADRIEGARTEAQKAEIRDEIRAKFPTQVADLEKRIAEMEDA